MTLIKAAGQLAQALERACAHLGRPNTFTCKFLAEYGGPSPMPAGRIPKDWMAADHLYECLGGEKGWGKPPTYSHGRWSV